MPFKVSEMEFKDRVFNSVEEYEEAKRALSTRNKDTCLNSICLDKEPEELFIEAELKDTSNRLTGVEIELRNFRDRVEEMLSDIHSSIKILLINKDGIPYMTKLKGISTVKGEFPDGKDFELLVTTRGYEINGQCYNSLSAAAEGVSGNRRNGWEWWKTEDGKTAASVFRQMI